MMTRTFFKPLFALTLIGLAAAGCADKLPEAVTVKPGADQVEVMQEKPNSDLYQPVGAVTAQVAGTDVSTATQEAKNELRNQTHTKGGTIVHLEDVETKSSMTKRGRTIIAMTGTAYKPR